MLYSRIVGWWSYRTDRKPVFGVARIEMQQPCTALLMCEFLLPLLAIRQLVWRLSPRIREAVAPDAG